jgi:hypothetical protein
MPWVVFEPTITASERAKTVHALDRSATVDIHLPSKIFKRRKNVSVLQNELKYKSIISEQNSNKIIPNKSKVVY